MFAVFVWFFCRTTHSPVSQSREKMRPRFIEPSCWADFVGFLLHISNLACVCVCVRGAHVSLRECIFSIEQTAGRLRLTPAYGVCVYPIPSCAIRVCVYLSHSLFQSRMWAVSMLTVRGLWRPDLNDALSIFPRTFKKNQTCDMFAPMSLAYCVCRGYARVFFVCDDGVQCFFCMSSFYLPANSKLYPGLRRSIQALFVALCFSPGIKPYHW